MTAFPVLKAGFLKKFIAGIKTHLLAQSLILLLRILI